MTRKICLFLLTVVVSAPALADKGPGSRQAGNGGFDPWHQRSVYGFELAKKWDELSPEEKRRVREAKERYRKLPEDKQEKLREKWEKMPKDEREKYKLERRYR